MGKANKVFPTCLSAGIQTEVLFVVKFGHLIARGSGLTQPKPVNHGQNDFLALLPVLNVTTKCFGELLSQQTWCNRETWGYSSLSRACFQPSPSASAASQAIKASGHRARGDPSSCETTPAREAALPRCHKPVSAALRAQLLGLASLHCQEQLFRAAEGNASWWQAQKSSCLQVV